MHVYVSFLRLLQVGQNAFCIDSHRLLFNAGIRIRAEMHRAEMRHAEMHRMGICRRRNDCIEPLRAESQPAERHGAGSVPNRKFIAECASEMIVKIGQF